MDDKSTHAALNKLSSEINDLYGIVSIKGDNYGEPAVNSGPCGRFAYEFYQQWNSVFKSPVKIAFIIDTQANECWHIVILLPDGMLFDGGIGVHNASHYDSTRFELQMMENFDYDLLDKMAYGLDRDYPRFCPDFSLSVTKSVIKNTLDKIK